VCGGEEVKTIFIVMEGGLIQNICNIPEDTKVTIIDYDTEGGGSEDMVYVDQGEKALGLYGSRWQEAYVSVYTKSESEQGVPLPEMRQIVVDEESGDWLVGQVVEEYKEK
jgi:hypothetical protein